MFFNFFYFVVRTAYYKCLILPHRLHYSVTRRRRTNAMELRLIHDGAEKALEIVSGDSQSSVFILF
jgi:hypothetical protein